MRALRPLLSDPPTQVVQGEEMRSADLSMPVEVGTPGLAPVFSLPLTTQPLVQADQAVGPMTLDGPIPMQPTLPFDRALRPRANAGIMTSAGFIPVIANECNLRLFERATNRFSVSGVTKDNTGAALPGCTVVLLKGDASEIVTAVVSDAGGAYTIEVPENSEYSAVAFNPARDRRGASVDMDVAHFG